MLIDSKTTFTAVRGAPVLTLEQKPVVRFELKRDQEVLAPGIRGYVNATVFMVKKDEAFAETNPGTKEGLYFRFWPKGEEWWCDFSVNKACVT